MISALKVGMLEGPLAPKASLGSWDTLPGLCGEACPDALLCVSSCALYLVGVINGVLQSSVSEKCFSPALKALHKEGCHLCHETQSPSQLSFTSLENAEKLLFRKRSFLHGIFHCCRGWRCWAQEDDASCSPGMIPLTRLMWCWGTVFFFLPSKVILVVRWLKGEVT